MSRNKFLFVALCLFLLAVNGYRWFQTMPWEQAKQILYTFAFLLSYIILPFGMVGYYILGTIRRVRARSRKKEPWEIDEEWR